MVEAAVAIPFTWRMENRFFPAVWAGSLHTFRATKALPEGRASLSATLLPDGRVSLKMENEVVAEGKLPGLFNTHPQDPAGDRERFPVNGGKLFLEHALQGESQ